MLDPEESIMKHIVPVLSGTLVVLSLVLSGGCALEKPAAAANPSAAKAGSTAPASGAPKVAAASDKLEPYSCGTVERLHTWNGIFAGSQPAAEDLQHAKDNGIKTILNLRPKTENAGFDEAALTAKLGLAYHNIPFASPAELTDAVFDDTRALLRDEAKRPLFIHCHSGNRVGAVWLAFRVLDGGVPWDAALVEAKEVGLKTPTLQERAKEYVDRVQAAAAAHR
jgi:uncharacterized protein (TIGR01244 family)